MEIVDNMAKRLRSLGRDEKWLQQWLKEDPSRLGLGNISFKRCELIQYGGKGGRLDILAYAADIDTYYEIELMLGECDADHGFRALDYWARERLSKPNSRHVAVLVAEDLGGRYKTIIETLPEFLPFIGIEIRTLVLSHDSDIATVIPTIVAQPDDLIIKAVDEPPEDGSGASPRDEEWWKANSNEIYISTVQALAQLVNDKVGDSRIDYSAQSYISLKKGRRCWLPMWPRKDGTYVYIPTGPGGAEDQPSDFYLRVQEQLKSLGTSVSWAWGYNAGSNAIGFQILQQQVKHSMILEILQEAYEYA